MAEFSLTSTAFENDSEIPRKYGYKYGNTSPPLSIQNIPDKCMSLALIMDDPDAMGPAGKVWVHWLIWNMPPNTNQITESQTLRNISEGTTDFGEIGYGGPAPPDRRHTYIFKLYALDSILELPKGADKKHLENAMKNHIIGTCKLTGTFES